MTVTTDTAAADSPSCPATWRRRAGVGLATALVVLVVPQASSGLEHTVAPGETLGLIAPTYGTSIEAIADREQSRRSESHHQWAGAHDSRRGVPGDDTHRRPR